MNKRVFDNKIKRCTVWNIIKYKNILLSSFSVVGSGVLRVLRPADDNFPLPRGGGGKSIKIFGSSV